MAKKDKGRQKLLALQGGSLQSRMLVNLDEEEDNNAGSSEQPLKAYGRCVKGV